MHVDEIRPLTVVSYFGLTLISHRVGGNQERPQQSEMQHMEKAVGLIKSVYLVFSSRKHTYNLK